MSPEFKDDNLAQVRINKVISTLSELKNKTETIKKAHQILDENIDALHNSQENKVELLKYLIDFHQEEEAFIILQKLGIIKFGFFHLNPMVFIKQCVNEHILNENSIKFFNYLSKVLIENNAQNNNMKTNFYPGFSGFELELKKEKPVDSWLLTMSIDWLSKASKNNNESIQEKYKFNQLFFEENLKEIDTITNGNVFNILNLQIYSSQQKVELLKNKFDFTNPNFWAYIPPNILKNPIMDTITEDFTISNIKTILNYKGLGISSSARTRDLQQYFNKLLSQKEMETIKKENPELDKNYKKIKL